MSRFWDDVLADGNPRPRPRTEITPYAPVPASQAAHTSRLPASARSGDTCPGCGGDAYFAPVGTNSKARCFSCGYPIYDIGNQMGTSRAAESTPARQTGEGGFHPHIGEFGGPR